MNQAKILPVVVVFVLLEAVNTLVNILLPILRRSPAQSRKQSFIRAGVVNALLIAGCLAYMFL